MIQLCMAKLVTLYKIQKPNNSPTNAAELVLDPDGSTANLILLAPPSCDKIWCYFQVTLPARLTVDQILNNYVKSKTATKSSTSKAANREGAVTEVSAGLKVIKELSFFSSSLAFFCAFPLWVLFLKFHSLSIY